jgi:hypothetical protein
MQRRSAVATVLVSFVAVTSHGHADTPTDENFRACNAEAEAAVKSGAATPTTKDLERAEAARKAAATGDVAAAPSDPQLRGMASDKATDAAYQAAYRGCMRRSGF